MFRFLCPTTQTGVFDLAVKATMLEAAFAEFHDFWFDEHAGHYAVFHHGDLVARVVPRANPDTGRNEAILEVWSERITEGNRFVCGD